jgi:hypothetical protein
MPRRTTRLESVDNRSTTRRDSRPPVEIPLTITGENRETTIVESLGIGGEGGGIYFVTNTIADFGRGTGQDSRWFIENTFDWLWPTKAHSGNILLVWDNVAWYDSWKNEMNSRAITWTERTGASLAAIDLNPVTYPLVIISDYMFDSSMNNMEALVPALEQYVEDGGVLVDMIGSNYDRRWSRGVPGPFGTQTVDNPNDGWNYVCEPTHPMVQGMSLPGFSGSSASHGRISVPPTGSTILLRESNAGGVPVACWLEMPGQGGNIFNIFANDVEISGFTIQGGFTGIMLNQSNRCFITQNNILCNNGIKLEASGNNVITDNSIVSTSTGGVKTLITQDFEGTFPPTGWTVMQYGDPGHVWIRGDGGENRANQASGMGQYAIADSDYWFSNTNTGLRTPSFSLVGAVTAQLEFDQYYWDIGNADYAEVRVSTDGGGTWTQIVLYTTSQGPLDHEILSLNAFLGQPNVMVEFHYDDQAWDWYWSIDNVEITATAITTGIDVVGEGWGINDDFSADTGIWTYYGTALRTGGYGRLTGTTYGSVGQILYNQQINTGFTAEFRYLAGGGDGADGMAMNFFKEAYTPIGGGSIGVVDVDGFTMGYAVEFDNYNNGGGEPSANHVALTYNGVANGVVNHLALVNSPKTEDNVWQQALRSMLTIWWYRCLHMPVPLPIPTVVSASLPELAG